MLDTFHRYSHPYWHIKKISKKQKQVSVLDIGPNGPGFAQYGRFKNIEITNLDIQPFSKRDIAEYTNVNFITYSGQEIPFTDNYFDCILCIDVLEHIPSRQREKFLSEIIRVTKKTIIIAFPISDAEPYERFLQKILKRKSTFLREHEEYGLPNKKHFKKIITTHGNISIKKEAGNMNLLLWIPIKLFSSLLRKIYQGNKTLIRVSFLAYIYSIGAFFSFGKCYSYTFFLDKKNG